MAGMIDQLIVLLNEQSTRYEELLGLSREKKDVIIANDVDALQKLTNLENLVVSQNQKLEKKRITLMQDIAAVLNKNVNDLTLAALTELMQGQAEHEALTEVSRRMRDVLSELSYINAHNASLIQNALDYIEFSLNVIRSSASVSTGTYSPNGEPLAENRVLFDAKH